MKSHEGSFIHYLEVTDQFGADAEWEVRVHYEYEAPDPEVGIMLADWRVTYIECTGTGEERDYDELIDSHQNDLAYALNSHIAETALLEEEREQAMAEDAADARNEMMKERESV
jgi:hypothetical protein